MMRKAYLDRKGKELALTQRYIYQKLMFSLMT